MLVESSLLSIVVFVVVRIHAQVVELELLSDSLFECCTFFQRQAVGLGNHWNDVDELAKLLQHDDIYGLEAVTGRLNEVETAVDSCVLNVALALCCKLLM